MPVRGTMFSILHKIQIFIAGALIGVASFLNPVPAIKQIQLQSPVQIEQATTGTAEPAIAQKSLPAAKPESIPKVIPTPVPVIPPSVVIAPSFMVDNSTLRIELCKAEAKDKTPLQHAGNCANQALELKKKFELANKDGEQISQEWFRRCFLDEDIKKSMENRLYLDCLTRG